MNMKRTMAGVLTAAMLCTGGLSAMAAPANLDTAPVSNRQQAMPSILGANLKVTGVDVKSGKYSNITVQTIVPEGSKETAQTIQLNLSEETVCINTKTGLPVNAENVKKGDEIYAYYSAAMTRSIPPQSAALALVTNLDAKAAPAHYLVAEEVTSNKDGSVTVLAENGTILVTVGKDTPIAPYKTRNIVKNSDITVGSRFFAWYDMVAMSMPGQAHALKAVLLPETKADLADKTKSGALKPGETAPVRIATAATITQVHTTAHEGDNKLVTAITVKPAGAPEMKVTLGEGAEIIDATKIIIKDIVDVQQQADLFKKGDAVVVYHAPAAAKDEAVRAQAVMVNIEKGKSAPHLLDAEKVTNNVDGSVTLLAENGGVLVTVGKDTPIAPYLTKNIVRNTDIRMGSTVLAWYDVVAASMPGQAQATRVVLLPADDREFTIITGGELAIAKGKLENGIAMVPLRKTAEALGFTVTWNAKDSSIGLKNDKVQTTVKLGTDLYFYSTAIPDAVGMSKPAPLGAAAYEKDGTSWVPAELFNLLGASASLRGGVLVL